MSQPRPLTVTEWREYLRGYSAEFLGSDYLREAEAEDLAKWMVSPAQRAAGWLGYEPASEQMLEEAEHRLGITLPASYQNFLLASNGWSTIRYWNGPFDLLGADKIGWFPDLEPELLDAWDMDHFGDKLAVLKRCVLIGHYGSGYYWLLHADSIADNGEWTAYEWVPGDGADPEPYDDFAAIVTEPLGRND
jgi:hypothetical protein